MITAFETEATLPGAADILANPNYNTPSYPVSGTGVAISGHTVYINPFSRLGNSCNDPLNFLKKALTQTEFASIRWPPLRGGQSFLR